MTPQEFFSSMPWRLVLAGAAVLGMRLGWHYMGKLIEHIDAKRAERQAQARDVTPASSVNDEARKVMRQIKDGD